MATSNVETLTKEYIQVVNRMTSLMIQLNEEKARAVELEQLLEANNKDLIPKEYIVQPNKNIIATNQIVKNDDDSDSESLSDSDDSVEFIKNLSDDDDKNKPEVKNDAAAKGATRGSSRGRGAGRGRGRGRGRGGKNGNEV